MRSEISAFIMFLKDTYHHSKWLFTIIVCFALGQAFINYKQGVVVSPLYHYGMYSGVFKVKEAYNVLLIEANGKILRGEDFTIKQWDKIYLPIQNYLVADSNNEQIIALRNKLYSALHLNELTENEKFFVNPKIPPLQFINWYHRYLEKTIKYPIRSLSIKKMHFKSYSHITGTRDQDSAKPILPVWSSINSIDTK